MKEIEIKVEDAAKEETTEIKERKTLKDVPKKVIICVLAGVTALVATGVGLIVHFGKKNPEEENKENEETEA